MVSRAATPEYASQWGPQASQLQLAGERGVTARVTELGRFVKSVLAHTCGSSTKRVAR